MNFLCLFVCVFPDVSRSLIVEARKLNVNRNTGETILHKAARLGYHVSITCTTLPLFELCQVSFRVLKCIRQIFFARLNLLSVLICTAKKIFDSDFPSACFDVPKASNFTSGGFKTARPKTGHWE